MSTSRRSFGTPELLRRESEEHRARLRDRRAQHRPEHARGQRTPRAHVPRAPIGVAQDHVDRVQAHPQLLGRHLRLGGHDALAHLDLPGEDHHLTVFVDPEVGVEVLRVFPALGESGLRPEPDEDDDAPAHELQKGATIEVGAHARPPLAADTDSMASRILL